MTDDDEASFEAEYSELIKQERKLQISDNAELLTLHYAAGYLGISADQVAGFVADGTLPYINVGRGKKKPRIRFAKPDLDHFIEQRRQREVKCPSIGPSNRRSIRLTSGTVVSDFLALRAAQLSKKPKPSRQ